MAALLVMLAAAPPARSQKLNLPPEAVAGQDLLYGGNPDAAIEQFRKVQRAQPENPLGYLLELNARWWTIYCETLSIKWNTIDAWRRERRKEDDAFLKLADKVTRLAEEQIRQNDTAELEFYAGMGYLERARLLGVRDDRRGTARAGVKAREHLLRAVELDPQLADAYTGLGLYNYYADTLSFLAKVLRFFMGIPGGDKKEGIHQLRTAIEQGELTTVEARFYLAKSLRNYDKEYAPGVKLIEPLVARYPRNPIFQLLLGDLEAKLGRRGEAAAHFRAAEEAAGGDPACAARVRQVAAEAVAALHARTNP